MSGWTLTFQAINFLVLVAVLRRYLFKPVAATIERRRLETERASNEADHAKAAAEAKRVEHEHALEALRTERQRVLEEAGAEAAGLRTKQIESARREGAEVVAAARAEIEHERADAADRLSASAIALASEVARRLLEQVAGGTIADAFLARLCDHLGQIPAEQLRTLRDDLGDGTSPIVVATAPALEPPNEARWARRLAESLGDRAPVRFVADSALIAGAELRLPRATFSFCFRDGLAAAREELTRHADSH